MKSIKFAALILLTALSTSCTHLASVSTTTVPAERGNKVESQTERFIFFAFNFNNDYVNDLALNLAAQCPKGRIEGVLTKQENITYFPLIAHKVRVTATGYCNSATKKQASL